MASSVLTRRALLRATAVGAAAAALAACTGGDGGPTPTAPGGPEDPDRALRAEIGRSESELIALYVVTADLLPAAAAARVRELGERHEAYRQAIDPDGLATVSPQSSASGSVGPTRTAPAPSPIPTPTGPLTPAEAVVVLRTAELSAAGSRVTQSVRSVDEELARVVALAGAGSAAAAEELRGGLA